MEKILKEQTSTIIKWKAIDGTEFDCEEECKKYENSAEGVLMTKYKPLIINTSTEWDLFRAGNDDNIVEILRLEKKEDVDVVLQLILLYNPHLTKSEHGEMLDFIIETLKKALKSSKIIFIGRGYEKDNFYFIGSYNSILDSMAEKAYMEKK